MVLLGLMGSGKTTLGRLLADALGLPLRDSDPDILTTTGETARELRERLGDAGLDAAESGHLLDAIASDAPSVVCAAAGVADDPACIAALGGERLFVVWLRLPTSALATRFAAGAHRPAYGDDPAGFLAEQAAQRDPRYASVADLTLDLDGQDPQEMAARVLAALAVEQSR